MTIPHHIVTQLPTPSAAMAAAKELYEQTEFPLSHDRLSKALDFVLSHAVILHPDGTATVRSGARNYEVSGGCSCGDAEHHGQQSCKHYLAYLIYRRALAQPEAASPPAPPAAAAGQGSSPTAANWRVNEAPASTCLKFRIGTMEMTHTMRDVNDEAIIARLQQAIPQLQDLLMSCEERQEALVAERETIKQAAAEASGGSPEAALPQLMQQALKALANSANGHSHANGSQPPAAAAAEAGDGGQSDGWCDAHQAKMKVRRNGPDIWSSHWVKTEERWCRGE